MVGWGWGWGGNSGSAFKCCERMDVDGVEWCWTVSGGREREIDACTRACMSLI